MLVVDDAELVWTSQRELPGARVVIDSGSVASVGSAEPPAGTNHERLDASGCIVIPGLVNAHHHLMQSAFRTLPDTRHVPMKTWLSVMADAFRRADLDPELINAAARVALAEALLSGVTTVADHHLAWPQSVEPIEIATATIAARDEVGPRLVFVRGTAGDDPGLAASSSEEIWRRFIAGDANHPEITGGVTVDRMLQLAVGPAGVHSDGAETFLALSEVALRYGLTRRTQANEQVDVEHAAIRYGRRPLELLEDWGWLDVDVTLAHLCAITASERQRLAAAGVSATHAPGCDLPMGWGVAEVGALKDLGVEVGLGTSGGGSNDGGHLLADARLALQVAAIPVAAAAAYGAFFCMLLLAF